MLSQQDKERLVKAQQSVNLAHQSILDLYKAENQLLAEHGFDMMETLVKMNQKLQRLLVVAK
jgi:predicted YcjX-like family ATPase